MRQSTEGFDAQETAGFQTDLDSLISSSGSSFVIKETGKVFKALTQFQLSQSNPVKEGNEGENVKASQTLMLYAVDRASQLQALQNVHRLDAVNPYRSNYQVQVADRETLGTTETRFYAVLIRRPMPDPETE
jgi:hypothetical protein